MTSSFQGERPSKEDLARSKAAAEYWRKVANEAPAVGLAKTEDAARQLVTLTGILQGLYFAVVTFANVRERATGWLALLFVLPPVFWFGSLFCATRVFVPQPRADADLNDPSAGAWLNLRNTYIETIDAKLRWLRWSHGLLIASFAVVLGLLAGMAVLPKAPAAGPTQIVILTPTPVASPLPTLVSTPPLLPSPVATP